MDKNSQVVSENHKLNTDPNTPPITVNNVILPQNLTEKKPVFQKHKKLFTVMTIFIIFYLILLSSYFLLNILNSKQNTLSDSLPLPTISPPTDPADENSITPLPTPKLVELSNRLITLQVGSISWYKEPKTVLPKQIFTLTQQEIDQNFLNQFYTDETRYFEVASTSNDQKILLLMVPTEGMGKYDTLMRFIESSEGEYAYIYGSAKYLADEELSKILLPEVKIVNQTIADLNTFDTETIGGIRYQKVISDNKLFVDIKNPIKITDFERGAMYRVDNKLWIEDFSARKLYLVLKDSSLVIYNLKVENVSDDLKQDIIWTDGVQSQDVYTQSFISGCGNSDLFHTTPVIPDNSDLIKSAVKIGKDRNGKPALQIKDPVSPFVKSLYEEVYKVGRDPSYSEDFLTIEEFSEKRNHYLFQDALGDWQLFINQNYAPMAECAKPVIYLYPEKETEVSVKIGAKIKESDPVYNVDGWKVTALPTGKLISNEKEFDYLFWDGIGHGNYPDIDSYGFVTMQSEVKNTLTNHLELLGLNEKETNDFLEYWLPLIPKSPYVRLTWLKTEEMNELAPILVYPKPDTVIRVFLEFEGLSEPVKLIPQKLSSIPRIGFTLVEWGGLLLKVK